MENIDNYRHKGLRRELVEAVRDKGIEDQEVLDALNHVPRHLFVDNVFDRRIYDDTAFPIEKGQTISQPFTVAYQTHLLQVEKGHKVLEIGTGSGYQAAVLAEMGARVFTVERQKRLHQKTKELLPEIGYSTIKCFYGDGYKGLPAFSPFNRIIVTAAVYEVPQALFQQLKVGGQMVVPIGGDFSQKMARITRVAEDDFDQETFEEFRFVPMLSGKEE